MQEICDTSKAYLQLLGLLKANAYAPREMVMPSGARRSFYIDCKQAILSAEGHALVGHLFGRLIHYYAPAVRAVGGMAMGADPIASAVAMASYATNRPLSAFYVRKEVKGGQLLEGSKLLCPGMPVAIVDDVITTGGSVLRAIARARAFGLQVRVILGIVDSEEGGVAVLEKEAPTFILFRRSDFENS
jgi:orotate phosphoribosyltransferase